MVNLASRSASSRGSLAASVVTSRPACGLDVLHLVRVGFDDTLSFTSQPDIGLTISQQFVDAIEDLGEGRKVVTSFVMSDVATWVEVATPDDPAQGPGVTVNELRALDGAALVIWLVASQEDIVAASQDAFEVLLDGAPVFDGLTVSEIKDAVA